jgi:HPt (histidine-containing phosphotransfer) domain-containing protein
MKNIINTTFDNYQIHVNHFNLERIKKYLGNDTIAIKEILLIVVADIKLSSKKIEHCIFTKNINEIKNIAHNLYGTCATIGLENLSKIARKIEQEQVFDDIAYYQLLKKLKSEISICTNLIHNYIYMDSF